MDFTNKVAISTGAASGMGLLFCREFIKNGGKAVLVDINEEKLIECVDEINKEYPNSAIYAVCDVRDYEQVTKACQKAVEAFGSIDVLANFAGGAETRIWGKSGDFCDIPIEVYDWGLDVNLKGQFYFDHVVSKQMKKQMGGVILNIGSITGEEGSPSAVAYSTSKSAAMNGLTKSIAKFGAKYNIRCCCISPGPVLTREAMSKMKTALGRAAEPIEIVNLALFVASDEGSFMDGMNILSDGGRNIMDNRG